MLFRFTASLLINIRELLKALLYCFLTIPDSQLSCLVLMLDYKQNFYVDDGPGILEQLRVLGGRISCKRVPEA